MKNLQASLSTFVRRVWPSDSALPPSEGKQHFNHTKCLSWWFKKALVLGNLGNICFIAISVPFGGFIRFWLFFAKHLKIKNRRFLSPPGSSQFFTAASQVGNAMQCSGDPKLFSPKPIWKQIGLLEESTVRSVSCQVLLWVSPLSSLALLLPLLLGPLPVLLLHLVIPFPSCLPNSTRLSSVAF